VAPGVVDARRCLSWLLQVDGAFPLEFREAVGDRIYGCDDCQEVCPPNRRLEPGAPPAEPDAVAEVPVLSLLEASDDELLARHGRWYVPRRDPDHIRRNALVVLGNVGDADDPRVAAALARYRSSPNPTLREHAEWASGRVAARATRAGGGEG
jgi:epoxyqueuosine reductase